MRVAEIFTSIQGESSHAGLPCTFIRFQGCNLACSYCDTLYARTAGDEGVEYTLDALMREVRMRAYGLVELTGGEPMIQEGVHGLVSAIIDEGHRVLIETNGSIPLAGLDPRAIVIMDVKTPGSGMADRTHPGNIGALKTGDEVKFVLQDRADYDWSRAFVFRHGLVGRVEVLFSPGYGALDPERLASWIIEDRLNVRLNLQLHKYIFGPDRRGV
jgi:7-carboxy-7-deazaguanine synthase